jgi:hypothetical protein
MIAFDKRDTLKQSRKDLKIAIQEAEEYIANCSHSIGPHPQNGIESTSLEPKKESPGRANSIKKKRGKKEQANTKSANESKQSPITSNSGLGELASSWAIR